MAKKEIDKEKKNKNFGKELKSELKKVSWPSPKQLVNNTSAVISIVLILAIIVFILDVCFESLNDFGIGRLKSLVSSGTEQPVEENVEEQPNEENSSTELDATVSDTTSETGTTDETAETDNNANPEVVQ